jgi:hypothetical protein
VVPEQRLIPAFGAQSWGKGTSRPASRTCKSGRPGIWEGPIGGSHRTTHGPAPGDAKRVLSLPGRLRRLSHLVSSVRLPSASVCFSVWLRPRSSHPSSFPPPLPPQSSYISRHESRIIRRRPLCALAIHPDDALHRVSLASASSSSYPILSVIRLPASDTTRAHPPYLTSSPRIIVILTHPAALDRQRLLIIP